MMSDGIEEKDSGRNLSENMPLLCNNTTLSCFLSRLNQGHNIAFLYKMRTGYHCKGYLLTTINVYFYSFNANIANVRISYMTLL